MDSIIYYDIDNTGIFTLSHSWVGDGISEVVPEEFLGEYECL